MSINNNNGEFITNIIICLLLFACYVSANLPAVHRSDTILYFTCIQI